MSSQVIVECRKFWDHPHCPHIGYLSSVEGLKVICNHPCAIRALLSLICSSQCNQPQLGSRQSEQITKPVPVDLVEV